MVRAVVCAWLLVLTAAAWSLAADFGPLCPWYSTNRAHWGLRDKAYYLEVVCHAEVPELGYPIARYELWIPVEKE